MAAFDRHKGIDKSDLSTTLIELEQRIFDEIDTIKAIVFVETKVRGERLTERLRTQFETLNPQLIVGHAGMTVGKQRTVLHDFRSFADG